MEHGEFRPIAVQPVWNYKNLEGSTWIHTLCPDCTWRVFGSNHSSNRFEFRVVATHSRCQKQRCPFGDHDGMFVVRR